jgi:hypothetical protein
MGPIRDGFAGPPSASIGSPRNSATSSSRKPVSEFLKKNRSRPAPFAKARNIHRAARRWKAVRKREREGGLAVIREDDTGVRRDRSREIESARVPEFLSGIPYH